MIRPCHVWITAALCLICVALLCYFTLLNDAYVQMLSSLQQEYRRLDEMEVGTARWSGCPRGLVVTSQQVSRPRDTCEHVWDYLGVWAAAKRFGIYPTIPCETLQLLSKNFKEPSIRSLEEVNIFCEVLNKKHAIKALTPRQILSRLGQQRSAAVDIVSLRRNETDELLMPFWLEIAYELRLKRESLERAQHALWNYGIRRLERYSSGEAELHFAGVHVTAATDEYKDAMEWLRRELSPSPLVFLVVCSADTKDWCRINLPTEDVFFLDPLEDEGCSGDYLVLFAACNHTILRYDQSSKFAVIASVLAEKQYKLVLGLSTGILADVPGWTTFNSQ